MPNKKFNLAKNIKFSVVGFIINIFLVFISYKLVILEGGIASVGLWATLMAWINIMKVGDVGMANASLKFVAMKDINIAEDFEKIKSYIDTGILANIVFFIVISMIGYITLSHFLPNLTEEESLDLAYQLLPIMFLIFLSMNVSGLLLGSIQGLHAGYIASSISVFGNVLQLGLVIYLVPKYGLIGLGWAQLSQYVTTILIAWLVISKKLHRKNLVPSSFSFMTLKEMLGYSWKAQVASTTNGLFEPLSKIFLSMFAGLHAQGLYELAYKTVSLTRNAVAAGLSASLPANTRLVEEDKESAKKFYKKSVKNITIAIVFVLSGVAIFSPIVALLMIGHYEMDFWIYVLIIAFGFVFNTHGAPAYNIGLATGQMKNNIVITTLTLGVLSILSFSLGYLYSDIGIVIAVSLSLIFGGLAIKHLNQRLLFGHNKDSF